MTNHERLLVALCSDDDRLSTSEVSVFEVVEMLYELGAEHRAQVHQARTLVNA